LQKYYSANGVGCHGTIFRFMKVYFKNLDGIRFIAAFLVVLHHAFFFKLGYSPGSHYLNHILEDAGRMGVNLFFVLSGFLISYLLFIEKDNTQTISYRNFYIRRILRIWPLYLVYGSMLIFLSPYILSKMGLGANIDFSTMLINFLFLLLFAVNMQLAFCPPNSGIFEISWSVCIEEQFYLIWPIIMNRFRNHLLQVYVVMVLIRLLLRILCFVIPEFYPVSFDKLVSMNYLLIFDKLDLFGGGMFVAWFYYNRERYQDIYRKIMHPAVQISMIIITIAYSLSLIPLPWGLSYFGDHLIVTILFGHLILTAIAENSVLNLENTVMKTLGKISYGIYLFHTAICQIVLTIFRKYFRNPDLRLLYDVGYPFLCTLITCILAYISYEYFEKVFLRTKHKFAVVKTRV